ncbi:MAG: sigma-70 family RNA polymerase sigma factor [Verrucomicrobiota bacterium]
MTEEPDEFLIQAAQSGDIDAMNSLLKSWNDPIFGFLLKRLGNRSDAEDAAQETFLRIVKGLSNYEHRGQFRAWVFQIVRNQAALSGKRRQQRTEREQQGDLAQIQKIPENANEYFAEFENLAALRAAIEILPAAEREVVLLRIDHELKFREIADKTGTSLNTVLGRMRNATKRLKETIAQKAP